MRRFLLRFDCFKRFGSQPLRYEELSVREGVLFSNGEAYIQGTGEGYSGGIAELIEEIQSQGQCYVEWIDEEAKTDV